MTVSWTLNADADGIVNWGPTPAYGRHRSDFAFSRGHAIPIPVKRGQCYLAVRSCLREPALGRAECVARGYAWVPIPGLCPDPAGCGFRCDIPTVDGGHPCFSAHDCQGVCLCGDARNETMGHCSRHVYYTEVLDCACLVNDAGDPTFPHGCS